MSEPHAPVRVSPPAQATPAAAERVRRFPQQSLEPMLRTAHAFSRIRVHAESPADALPAAVEQVRRPSGHPLEPALRVSMERRFLHDFSRVRVHVDGAAAETAAALQARAYTVGPHISFARGAYDPATDAGRRLVAHELAHVVQQSRTHGWRGEATQSAKLREPPTKLRSADS